jgi:hypothetical protein
MNAHHLEKLTAARAALDEEIAALREHLRELTAKRQAFDEALAIVSDTSAPEHAPERRARGAVKDTALRLLQAHVEHGLTALELVEVAAREGITLDRASISSLLSKLKAQGTLVLDVSTSKYRPAPPEPAKAPSVGSGSPLFEKIATMKAAA